MRKDLLKHCAHAGSYGFDTPKFRGKLDPRKDWDDEDYVSGGRVACRRAPNTHLDDWDKGHDFNYAPLRRWLGKQVGRPWNLVWSEICSMDRAREFRQKVEQMVYRAPEIFRWRDLYVDPKGILRIDPGFRHRHRRNAYNEALRKQLREFGFPPDSADWLKESELADYLIGEIVELSRKNWLGIIIRDRVATIYHRENALWYVYRATVYDPVEVINGRTRVKWVQLGVDYHRGQQTKRQANKKDLKIIRQLTEDRDENR